MDQSTLGTAAPVPLQQPIQPPVQPVQPRSIKKILLLASSIVVTLALVGGGYFAYLRGYISIPGLTPKADALFATMLEKLDSIKNAEYGLTVTVDSVPRASGAQPTFASLNDLKNTSLQNTNLGLSGTAGGLLGLVDPSMLIQALPSDVHLKAGMTLQAESNKLLKDADGNLHLTGVYQGGDSSYNVDIEAKKVDENIYFILNKIPGLPFFDLTSIKGNWVTATPSDTGDIFGDAWGTADPQQGSKQLQKYITTALKKNIVTVKKQLPAVQIDGVQAAQYEIEFHVDQIVPVYEQIRADMAATNTSTTGIDAVITELKKSETQQTLQRLADASVFTIAVDKVQGLLRKVEWKLTVVPPNDIEKLKDKQFVFDTVFSLRKINAEVQVEAPSKTMLWEEMIRLVSGITKAEQDFQTQTNRVRDVRGALAEYHQMTGKFPATITDLKSELAKEYQACTGKKELLCSDYAAGLLKESSTIDKVTGLPFVYTLSGADDFTLVYQIHLDSSVDSYSSKKYVEGKNTSTKLMVSVEGKYDAYDMSYIDPVSNVNLQIPTLGNSNTNSSFEIENIGSSVGLPSSYTCLGTSISKTADYDKDVLTDYDEYYYYYTNPCVADTDGDSYTDGDEVKSGYNPVGTGTATESQKTYWPKTSATGAAPTFTLSAPKQSGSTVTIAWSTDRLADGVVNFGETIAYGGIVNSYPFTLDHSLAFTVQAGKTYHYAIRSCVEGVPAATGCITSSDYTYTAK